MLEILENPANIIVLISFGQIDFRKHLALKCFAPLVWRNSF